MWHNFSCLSSIELDRVTHKKHGGHYLWTGLTYLHITYIYLHLLIYKYLFMLCNMMYFD
jgi:hypothetical protein